MYAQVVFPLPFRNAFTYSIPDDLEETVKTGVRVVVPFGKRTLTGFVIDVSETTDVKEKIKPIRDVLDETPIFDKDSLKFYEWISGYYLSSLGEALKNSVPYGSDVESKRKIVSDRDHCEEILAAEKKKSSIKAKLLAALSQKEIHRISSLQKTVKRKNIYSALRSLENEGAISILNEIEDPKVSVKKVKFVEPAKPLDEIYDAMPDIESSSPKQVVILLELLAANGKPLQLSELLKNTNTHRSSVTSLETKGLVRVFDKEVERVYSETYKENLQELILTSEQSKIVEEVKKKIEEDEFTPYLLRGVTGSGKTQVYIELTKTAIAKNKTALILVPEISLTPQITSRFLNTFGKLVTVIHSRMSLGERYDSWRGIISGKYKIIIGARSALFAPLKNIGLIVVDEEHDQSYKQHENIPKYNARDSAVVRAQLNNCPVLLGSATPSIESFYNAAEGKYNLLELNKRIDDAKLPMIKLVNVNFEKKKHRMNGIFSDTLLQEIKKRLEREESVIILQNRRGFATHIFCEDCGEIEECPHCSVSLVYHLNSNLLRCHYCGYTKPTPRACSNCGSISMKFFGTGTQKVEDELTVFFPDIKIERIDSDSISKKGNLGLIMNRFRKGEIDLLVGTQMVSKGLDFSNVTLVGVISAETTLWLPDFRADERTFQLLTQVAGRSGRSKTEGEVLIQTQDHNHFVLQKVLNYDNEGFYERELKIREQFNYPPFTRLGLIESKDENESAALGAINDFHKLILKYRKGIEINKPNPAVIAKIKNQYRFHLLIRSGKKLDPSGKLLRGAILNAYIEFKRVSKYRDIKLFFDIDPQSIL